MNYKDIYYTIILFNIILINSYITNRPNVFDRYIRYIGTTLLLIIYLTASFRKEGIDYYQYLVEYTNVNQIPDFGYRYLNKFFNIFGISFNLFLFFIGCLSIYSINRIAKFYKLAFPLCFILFLSHSAIVRDLAQLRVGLALSLFFIGLTSNRIISKWVFYLLGTTIHFTALIAIIGYEVCSYIAKLKNNINRFLWFVFLIIIIFMAGYFLETFSIIDKRIDIYLAWTESGYGLPIDSYGPLYLHICVLILYAILNYNFSTKILELRPLVYLEYLGIIIFLSFSNNAIFAYRLTNVITSLYFILIAKSLSLAYSNEYTSLSRRIIIVLILCCIIISLLMRTGNSEILTAISF